jgi:two-component sensor histidine kinase
MDEAQEARAPRGLWRPRWLQLGGIWCAYGLFAASQAVLTARAEGKHHPLPPLFATEFASWLPWALATPLVVALARRYPLHQRMNVSAIGVHLAAFAAVSVVTELLSASLQVAFNPWGNRQWPTFVDTFSTTLIFQVLLFVVVYTLILTVTYLVDARERIARQATEAARLGEELSNARLAALRGQMEPHFMYNALNSIAGLVRDEHGEEAIGMIVGLSEFLRRASEDSHRSEVTLAEEVEYLERYLDIQKVRFGERLQVRIDIPTELMRARVPNLLLQPLVENAIKHGIIERIAGGTVRVGAVRRNDALVLTIRNDGPALPADWQPAHIGVGIGNLRARLRILHGGEGSLQLSPVEGGGVEAIVRVPLVEK